MQHRSALHTGQKVSCACAEAHLEASQYLANDGIQQHCVARAPACITAENTPGAPWESESAAKEGRSITYDPAQRRTHILLQVVELCIAEQNQ